MKGLHVFYQGFHFAHIVMIFFERINKIILFEIKMINVFNRIRDYFKTNVIKILCFKK